MQGSYQMQFPEFINGGSVTDLYLEGEADTKK